MLYTKQPKADMGITHKGMTMPSCTCNILGQDMAEAIQKKFHFWSRSICNKSVYFFACAQRGLEMIIYKKLATDDCQFPVPIGKPTLIWHETCITSFFLATSNVRTSTKYFQFPLRITQPGRLSPGYSPNDIVRQCNCTSASEMAAEPSSISSNSNVLPNDEQ